MHTPMTLDELATGWLTRRVAQWDANPGLNNALGSIQIEADPVAFKHPVFPPYSAGNEITGFTLFNGRNVALTAATVQIRWRAFEVERRAATPDGWELSSRTTLLPDAPGVLVELTVRNTAETARPLDLALILSGRARNTGAEGYNWCVPEIPTGMFSFRESEGLAYTVEDTRVPDGICFVNDTANACSVQSVWPAPDEWRERRVPSWTTVVAPGGSFRVCLLCTYHADRNAAEALAARWHGCAEEAFATARAEWEALWAAAFTPGNAIFSGALPALDSDDPTLRKLYYTGVLTLLTLRRSYPGALVTPAYITLWPRRGEGSVYLSWELPYTSGLLARLDPAVLREMLLLAMSAPELQGQMTNYFNGKHWGWGCCVYPHAIIAASLNLLRCLPDRSWLDAVVQRRPEGQPADATPDGDGYRTLTAREAFLEMVTAHRRHHLPDTPLVDFGSRHAYHEVLTTYAHGTAGHTAVHAWALHEATEWLGEETRDERRRLRDAVLALYRPGAGYFDCQHPDGSRHAAANLYDLGLVLNTIGEELPTAMLDEIEAFVRRELATPTWAHCLSPNSPDIVDGMRADHGWSGCFVAWPPQFVRGLLRAGRRPAWVAEWLDGMAKLTAQGPFGQGYWADDLYPTECGAAAKVFDDHSGCLHWVIGSGAYFAELALAWVEEDEGLS
jgi:hypothetical protein